MVMQQMVGIALCILGASLIYFGYQESTTERMAGDYTAYSGWYMLGGMVTLGAGILLALFGRSDAHGRRDRI